MNMAGAVWGSGRGVSRSQPAGSQDSRQYLASWSVLEVTFEPLHRWRRVQDSTDRETQTFISDPIRVRIDAFRMTSGRLSLHAKAESGAARRSVDEGSIRGCLRYRYARSATMAALLSQ